MHRTVELSGKPYAITILQHSASYWRVIGEVEGQVVAVGGPTRGSAINRWLEKVRTQLYLPRELTRQA